MQPIITPERAMQIARMDFGPEWSRAYDDACQGLRQAAGLDISDVSSVACEDDCSLANRCPLKAAEDRLYQETVSGRAVNV